MPQTAVRVLLVCDEVQRRVRHPPREARRPFDLAKIGELIDAMIRSDPAV